MLFSLSCAADDPRLLQTPYPTTGALRGFEVWQVVAVAAISVILLAIIVACCICLWLKRKRRSAKESESPQKNSFPTPNAIHSNLTIQTTIGSSDNMSEKVASGIVNGAGMVHGVKLSSASSDRNLTFAHAEHMTVDVSSTMSPVQSWPAEVLLGHYGKVQQARERNHTPPVVKIEDVLPDGSYSTGSDNPSHESSQYDEHNLEHAYPVAMATGAGWGYENVFLSHAQPAYVSPYGVPAAVYGDPAHAFDAPTTHLPVWQERQFIPQRPHTPSDSYPPDPRYQQVRRSTNTVSQV